MTSSLSFSLFPPPLPLSSHLTPCTIFALVVRCGGVQNWKPSNRLAFLFIMRFATMPADAATNAATTRCWNKKTPERHPATKRWNTSSKNLQCRVRKRWTPTLKMLERDLENSGTNLWIELSRSLRKQGEQPTPSSPRSM